MPLTESAEAQARHAAERIEAADQASSRIRMIERAEADRASGATACGATTAC
ncbi:hypothetical protein [Sphingomonas folli]|uniref:hypothetical protein n=1 Tax=Sphingomonas folli TaxID=2862497 RepID=UPI001CA4F6D1|nr:hypothetical protein [Sphingomonas folli]